VALEAEARHCEGAKRRSNPDFGRKLAVWVASLRKEFEFGAAKQTSNRHDLWIASLRSQ
jgi:hypothetical protein